MAESSFSAVGPLFSGSLLAIGAYGRYLVINRNEWGVYDPVR